MKNVCKDEVHILSIGMECPTLNKTQSAEHVTFSRTECITFHAFNVTEIQMSLFLINCVSIFTNTKMNYTIVH